MKAMKAIKILSDIKLSSDNMSLELHPNCTLDDVYQGIEEINKIISFKNNFEEYGFEADFEGEIYTSYRSNDNQIFYNGAIWLKPNDDYHYMKPVSWTEKGEVIHHYFQENYLTGYRLKPIKKEWYENPDNFPCLVMYEDKEIKLMKYYVESSKHREAPCLLTADGLVYHSLSKCRLATEEEALKLVKKV